MFFLSSTVNYLCIWIQQLYPCTFQTSKDLSKQESHYFIPRLISKSQVEATNWLNWRSSARQCLCSGSFSDSLLLRLQPQIQFMHRGILLGLLVTVPPLWSIETQKEEVFFLSDLQISAFQYEIGSYHNSINIFLNVTTTLAELGNRDSSLKS